MINLISNFFFTLQSAKKLLKGGKYDRKKTFVQLKKAKIFLNTCALAKVFTFISRWVVVQCKDIGKSLELDFPAGNAFDYH